MTKQRDIPLELDIREEGAARVVRVLGSVGMNEAERLRVALDELVALSAGRVVLDLTGMDFICSLGLGAMISARQKLLDHEGELRLVNPQPPIREMLEATRLTELFAIYGSIEEAVA